MNQNVLDYYLRFSQYTDPGLYKDRLRNLPDRVEDIGLLARKQLVHSFILRSDNAAKIPWYKQCEDDIFPTASAMLAELYRRNEAGFVPDREPKDKLILTCRFVAILISSILKSKGIPTRVRVSFVPYIERFKGKYIAHHMNQYWNDKEKRWATIDIITSFNRLPFNPFDVPKESFDFSADAWLNVRSGREDGKRFCHWKIADHPVLAMIAIQLLHDFHNLMGNEIIYSHVPEKFDVGNFDKLAESDLAEIDQLARLMRNPDENFEKLQEIWETNKDFRHLTGALLS